MLYQNLLTGSTPYYIAITRMNAFEMHRHPEIEFLYCLEGACDIIVNRKSFHLTAGALAFIGSMLPHEILSSEHCRTLVIEVGPVLLGEYFEPLAKLNIAHTLLQRETNGELYSLFEETAALQETGLPFSELHVRGNIYRICASILQKLTEDPSSAASRTLVSVSNVEKALELIETRFNEPLTIDYVSSLCGYGKSNFCRIFRHVTGETFHNLLTRRRIQAAQLLLKETDSSIEGIALQTGFADSKNFCRAFRQTAGLTPGEYRESARSEGSAQTVPNSR